MGTPIKVNHTVLSRFPDVMHAVCCIIVVQCTPQVTANSFMSQVYSCDPADLGLGHQSPSAMRAWRAAAVCTTRGDCKPGEPMNLVPFCQIFCKGQRCLYSCIHILSARGE